MMAVNKTLLKLKNFQTTHDSALTNPKDSVEKVLSPKNEKSTKRISIYEVIDEQETIQPHDKEIEARLAEWDRRWGKYNTDYVNVLTYPIEHVEKLKEEKKVGWKILNDMDQKVSQEIHEYDSIILNEDILTDEEKATLQQFDSRIKVFMDKGTTFLKNFEMQKRILKAKLEKIQWDAELVDNIARSVTRK